MCVCPHRAARAFGEYLSHTHPENRNGSGQRLCHPSICPSLYPVLHYALWSLILPPPASSHSMLKIQAVIISVSLQELIIEKMMIYSVSSSTCPLLFPLSLFSCSLASITFFKSHICLSLHYSSSSSVWNFGGSWPRITKWHYWPKQQQQPPSLHQYHQGLWGKSRA